LYSLLNSCTKPFFAGCCCGAAETSASGCQLSRISDAKIQVWPGVECWETDMELMQIVKDYFGFGVLHYNGVDLNVVPAGK
jgi:hypothetical protein